MRRSPASLLVHRLERSRHLDLVIGAGRRCPTLSLAPLPGRPGRFSARWLDPHRRRYLSFSGPLGGGRGAVSQAWHGHVAWHRDVMGWRFLLAGATTVTMRAASAQIGSARATASWSRAFHA